jgi:hypothetical protein
MEILTWIIANLGAIGAGAAGILGGLALIAKLTPTPKDDAIIAKLLEFFNLWPKQDEDPK